MFLERVYDESLAQAAYVVACDHTGLAIVIDPNRDVESCLRVAEQEDFKIVAVTETHIHADFLSGSRELASGESSSTRKERAARRMTAVEV